MKPIKAYILMHRYGDQTRVRPWVVWSVIAFGVMAAAIFACVVWWG